jgi:transposase
LLDADIAVFSINPKQLDRFRDRHNVAGAKDDRLDAFVLASSLRTDPDLFRRVSLGPAEIIELRELSRTRDDLVEDRTRSCGQLRDLLLRTNPELLLLCAGANQKWLWDVLAMASSPKALRKLKAKQLEPVLRRVKRFTARDLEAVLAKPFVTAPGVAESVFKRIKLLLPLLQTTQEQLDDCEQQLKKLLEDLPRKGHRDVSLLLSLPGLGMKLTAVLVAEAREPLAARDYQRLRALTGVAPISKKSGVRKGPLTPVSMRRACNHRLRFALFHWARAAIPLCPLVKEHYRRLRARGHTHARALRGVGDRLLRIAVGVLKSGQPFERSRLSPP